MSESNLTTAVYYEQAEELRAAVDADPSRAATANTFSTPRWERATSRFSLIVAGALAVCSAVLGITYVMAVRDKASQANKRVSPVDWFLRFRGAKPNQTFESFIQESTQHSQREWEDRFRDSPAYNPKMQPRNWQFQPAPAVKKRGSR